MGDQFTQTRALPPPPNDLSVSLLTRVTAQYLLSLVLKLPLFLLFHLTKLFFSLILSK